MMERENLIQKEVNYEEITQKKPHCIEPRREASQPSESRSEQDIDALVALLDGYTRAGDSRIRVDVVEGEGEVLARQYHHGRCDVGSPWARGTAFDVLE